VSLVSVGFRARARCANAGFHCYERALLGSLGMGLYFPDTGPTQVNISGNLIGTVALPTTHVMKDSAALTSQIS